MEKLFDKMSYINNNNFFIFALASLGQGISGGDRIYIELARRWSKNHTVKIFVWEEGKAMCERQKLVGKNLTFNLIKVGKLANLGFVFTYFYRIILGIRLGLTFKLINNNLQPTTIIYSASEFWMDSLPAFLLKLRYGNMIKWVAAWYQTAPNPIKGFIEKGSRENKYLFKSLVYWLVQLPIKPLIAHFADIVVINNEDERRQFPGMNERGKVFVMIGAVDLENIGNWKLKIGNLPKVYDAVFQGRFHPQKGVVELIDIWKKVVEKKPGAVLAMIGDGPLMQDVRNKIEDLGLKDNVKLFGYVYDGPKKYKIFTQSNVVVHPAFYDSGGMASAEAMAFGLPCVGFDLKSYASYYPMGMVKVKIGDMDEFSKAVLQLLENESRRKTIGLEAKAMIEKYWSWNERANCLLLKISK
jgi:glycosyltransferase involved in cell wall biosynthesis